MSAQGSAQFLPWFVPTPMTRGNDLEENLSRDAFGNRSGKSLGNPLWRNGAMTPTQRCTNESWPLLERIGAAGLAAEEMSALPEARWARVEQLARRARHDQAAALSLLGVLEPELSSMGRRLVRLGTPRDDAEAVTVSVAWEVVSGHKKLRRPRSLSELVETIWREARQEARVRRLELDTVPLLDDVDMPVCDTDRLERWPGLLAAAVAAGVLTPRQVVILALSRMDEHPLAEVAKALGRPYDAVRMERYRAEKALWRFALSYDWSAS